MIKKPGESKQGGEALREDLGRLDSTNPWGGGGGVGAVPSQSQEDGLIHAGLTSGSTASLTLP